MVGMEAVSGCLTMSVSAVAALDCSVVPVDWIGPGILAVQAEIDRSRIVQAHWLQTAHRHRIWEASGHRDIAG